MATSGDTARTSVVRSFLLTHRTEILARWRQAARAALPEAKDLTPIALVDHVPELIDELAEMAASISVADDAPGAMARRHALDRIAEGFDLSSVVRELSLLRRTILDLWHRERVDNIAELRALDLAIDRVIEISVARYAEAREDRARQLADDRERTLAKLESLLAASPIGIAFLDHDLRYVRINEALATLNGAAAEQHIGRTVAEMLGEAAPHVEALLRHVLDSGEPALNLEFVVPHPLSAAGRTLLANYFPVRSPSGAILGVGGIVTDVTETKRAREELQLQQQRLQSIVEHAPAAIWVKDIEGRLLLANHRLADALGHHYEAVLGKRSDELLPSDIAAAHQSHDRTVLAENRAIEVEEVTPSPDGLRTFLSIKFPIPGDPPLVGGIATEITERKRMEEELRVALTMRDDLLAVVSHDLRNPVATVQLSASLLMSQLASDPRARRHVDMIVRSCARMENLIDDLLDMARIRAGHFELELRREVVDDVVNEALDLQAPLAAEKGIKLVRLYEVAGLHIMCDRNRIAQVFGNLIGNAVKFCRSGDTITVTGTRDGELVKFCVEDTGPGLAPDALPKLFEPYWSGSKHTTDGAGLGLYIVRGIVENHGGRVWAESAAGAGARFLFTLPIAA